MTRPNDYRAEAQVRSGLLRGREAYEASLKVCPTYEDGTPRPKWEKLGPLERWSWERN